MRYKEDMNIQYFKKIQKKQYKNQVKEYIYNNKIFIIVEQQQQMLQILQDIQYLLIIV
jgi:hypothetical protein